MNVFSVTSGRYFAGRVVSGNDSYLVARVFFDRGDGPPKNRCLPPALTQINNRDNINIQQRADLMMMMMLQQCMQASQFQSASKENASNKEMMKVAESSEKLQQMDPPTKAPTPEPVKDVKVDGLTIDENTPKRETESVDLPTTPAKDTATPRLITRRYSLLSVRD